MKRLLCLLNIVVLVWGATALTALAQTSNRPSSLLKYQGPQDDEFVEGDGYMVAGDLWDTVKPMNTNEQALLQSPYRDVAGGILPYFHLGANDANFYNPGGMWPNAYRIVNLFRNARKFGITAFEPEGWPGYAAGNPIYDLDQGLDSRFMVAAYGPNVAGADDPSRNYQREAVYTDETRTHLVYEAGWPTTAGIDVKLRAHQYTPNEQNLNDFVVLEMTLTNTGAVDSDANGTIEASDHAVDALVVSMQGETAPAIKIGFNGERLGGTDGGSKFGAGRSYGYVGAPDPEGNPYDLFAWYANVPPGVTANRSIPPPGERDFGINNYTNRDGYTDVWSGWRWLGVKQGRIEDAIQAGSVVKSNLSSFTPASPDKQTLFGTHPIGEGPERGWYTSHTYAPGLVTYRWNNAVRDFRTGMATWFADYGRQSDDETNIDLSPNPNFFASGTDDDPTTWVPLDNPQRPNGDFKYASEDVSKEVGIQQPVWEEAWNPALRGQNADAATASDFYQAVGYVREWTFGESNKNGVGPFSLAVGESMTVTFVAMSGFRFQGIYDAAEAAEWAWERGWLIEDDLPVPPAPDMKVESTPEGTALLHWTDVSAIDPDISGYKIWRASQYQRKSWLEEGMRLVDRRHHVHEVGQSIDALLDPINRFFDAQGTFTEPQGIYQPEEWGTYELIAKIPSSQLGEYSDSGGPYDYVYEDEASITGFTYWYYISSYKEGGSWTGPQGPVDVGYLESAGINRNGRNTSDAPEGIIGLRTPWGGIYPFARQNANYPSRGTLAFKNFGAEFTVTPPVAASQDVENLITVNPNPYKITGLNDVRTDPSSHFVFFQNLPATFTLTILDVSGQIIYQADETSAQRQEGQLGWDMFSKDGVEVASGLYIYHVEYDGGEITGHFAILR